MTQIDKEKIVDKIKKLFALSESPNENEAARALENANRLLLKYNLEMKDINNDININSMMEETLLKAGRLVSWKIVLYIAVSKLNNCVIYISNIRSGNKSVQVIGKKQNIEITSLMFEYLSETLEAKMKISRPYDKKAFRQGFCDAIESKILKII